MSQGAARTEGDRRAPSRGDQQRAVIIDAVADLLQTVPIEKLSVIQIASRAGVTRPAFYFYFESKYSVVAAALQQVWAEIDQATQALTTYDFEESPAAFSDRMIRSAVEVVREHSVLLNACAQARPSDPQLARMWDEFVASLTGKLAAFVVKLRAAGRIHPASEDIPSLIEALVGMTIWAVLDTNGSSGHRADRLENAIKAIWLAAAWGSMSGSVEVHGS